MTIMQLSLIVIVGTAAWCDVRTRHIPNWLTAPAAVLGLVTQSWVNGWRGALTSISGAALAFGIFILLYLFAGMGAGDVKLFAAVGAFVGPQTVPVLFVLTALLGGVAGIVLAASRGRLQQTLTGESLNADVEPLYL